MFEYIKGNIIDVGIDYLILENNGIGYKINTSKASAIDIGQDYQNRTIYTHLNVREDDISLYGFTSKDEIDMFRLLQTVSKIGPKVALGVLSNMNTLDLKLAIVNEDVVSLSKSPGIGKKTAERLILELKDKIHLDKSMNAHNKLPLEMDFSFNNSEDEVTEALISLGYTKTEVFRALSKVNDSEKSTEELIKLTLKELSRQ